MSLKNEWHHRKVAEGQGKACWICYKPSTSVLITPDNKVCPARARELHTLTLQDFFYICTGHLKDRGFCTPDADEVAAAEEKRKKEELDREIEKVKKEYMDRQDAKAKKRKEREKKKDKDKEKSKEDKKDDEAEDKNDEKERDEKVSLRRLHICDHQANNYRSRSRLWRRKLPPRMMTDLESSTYTSMFLSTTASSS